MPDIERLFLNAVAAHRAGDLNEAERLYKRILEARPQQFDTLNAFGHLELQRGRLTEAYALFTRALKLNPRSSELRANRGTISLQLGRSEEAIQDYDKALAVNPKDPAALMNRGTALANLHRHEEALSSYGRALAIQPSFAPALYNQGNVLLDMQRPLDALASYDQAVACQPNYAEAFHNRGVALRQLHRLEEAVHSYRKAIAIKPGYAEAFNHLGESLHQLNQLQEALQSYEAALAIQPNFAEALNNRAAALMVLHRLDEALRSCDQALAIKPDFANALVTRGYILQDLERHEEAAASFRVAMKLDPEHEYALGGLIYSALQACDWSEYAQLDSLSASIQASKRVALPFVLTAVSASPQEQYLCSKILVAHRCPPAPAPIWRGEQYKHAKIRLAYLSADFYDHATAFLMAGLFEHHDATRFETTAVSFGPSTRSDMRSRLEGAFERFIDVQSKSDREVATLLRELEIDIAVDLKGFTTDSRTGILAHRPAPIQVSYLGYPGTMGADYIDYILADRYVIPEKHHAYYAEKVVYLPDTYQVNDRKRRIAERTPTRGEAGLPDRGFVFCSFNRNYKITPSVFDIWMRLLREVDGSVLWLLEGNADAPRHLRSEATIRGVAPDRLVFAARVEPADHLARHRLADLFLDTLPCNAHTTASDALWAGLPLLTCLGTTFAGRVAGSLLNAIGLPELITHSLQEYEALAFKLATDGKTLLEIKQQLARNRETFPLFDTDRFRRHIEAAYLSMWERYQRGQTPASFAVDPIDQ